MKQIMKERIGLLITAFVMALFMAASAWA